MESTKQKISLSGMTIEELEDLALKFDQPKFRASQLSQWVHKKNAKSFEEMTNLSKDFRAKLEENTVISTTIIKERLISRDGTIKYLLEFPDGNCVETVLMRFDNRPNLTACVSSQVGCPVGCLFCATGQNGFKRNLTKAEIVDQILTIQRDTDLEVTNIVFMGQGEPFLNYDNVVEAIHTLNKQLEIGMRRMTVSTSGIVPKIKQFSHEHKQLNIALSLHAPTSALRQKLMPIEKKYNLDELINSLKYFTQNSNRRITIEYTLIKDVNDSPDMARKLNYLLKDINYIMNLIPYNPASDDKFKAPTQKSINSFKYILEQSGKNVTVRLERGADIMAACGQLSGKALKSIKN